jgi:hypothetical protein
MRPLKPRELLTSPKRLSGRRRAVTICLASFADDQKGIVCIADKGITYGDSIQWYSDNSKIITLNRAGTTVLIAGNDQHTARVMSGLMERADEIGDSVPKTKEICEKEYTDAMDELVEAYVLRPNLLNKQDYLEMLKSPHMNTPARDIAKKVARFEMDCQLIVCGIDGNNTAFILDVGPPGIALDCGTTGYAAIGTGWEKAISKLLYSEHKRSHSVYRVLYDVFDAKAYAEMVSTVGYEWDAKVLYIRRCIFELKEKPKGLIERIWAKYNRSPFEERKKDDLPNPPKHWKRIMSALDMGVVVLANNPPQPGEPTFPLARNFGAEGHPSF